MLTSDKVVAIKKHHVLYKNEDGRSISVRYVYIVMANGSGSVDYDKTVLQINEFLYLK